LEHDRGPILVSTAHALDATAQLLDVFRALANPVRLQVLQWLARPEQHFPVEEAIADADEVGVCVSHIQAKTGPAQSVQRAGWSLHSRREVDALPTRRRAHRRARRHARKLAPAARRRRALAAQDAPTT
jgi:hypothetical protein